MMSNLPPSLINKPRPWLMAHRGNRVACPENTLAAFRRAFDEGADILETDLHVTRDGAFVCIHDGRLDRTTDSTGEVAQLTLREIQGSRAAYGRAEFADEVVPTLAQLAAILPQDVLLALELKTDRFLVPEVAAGLATQLADLGIRARCAALSFSMERLHAVRAAAPELLIGWITLTRPWPVAGVNLVGPFWPLAILNPFYVAAAHRQGQIVCPLDPTPDRRLGLYCWLGCDAVLTDDPGSTRRALLRFRRGKSRGG
jgi:glycerophosphoryl diester phosphodiesterase